jgi:putative phosphoesterase
MLSAGGREGSISIEEEMYILALTLTCHNAREGEIMRIGVIADTHGKVLPEVHDAFAGVSLILHAGDIGSDAVIAELETIARVIAVRGNVDSGLAPPLFPDTRRLTLEGVDIFLCHEPARAANLTPAPAVVICGHTHHARNEVVGDTRWFNPGSAGKPKVAGLYTVGILTLKDGHAEGEIIRLR